MLKIKKFKTKIFFLLIASAIVSGCSSTPPSNKTNLCSIFQEKDDWYNAAHKVHQKYGVPINVAMAIIYHESGYKDDAKPPMRWFLFIPYGRGSSSYGYSQAQDEVWSEYVSEQGSMFSSRSDFQDSLDFVGWYMTKSKQRNGVPFSDAYNQYLNYHEGWNGYKNRSYENKTWLKGAAKSVEATAKNYKNQLMRCNLY